MDQVMDLVVDQVRIMDPMDLLEDDCRVLEGSLGMDFPIELCSNLLEAV